MGSFTAQTTNSSPLKPSCEWRSARPNAPSVRQRQGHYWAPGAWVNTDQSSQHKLHTGLCKAAVGHLATSQRSVLALCATTAVTLRIEVAGANPMACWRNADCGERSSKTWNEARKRKGVCVWQEWKDSSRVREGDEKELTKAQKGVIEQAASFPLIRSLCVRGKGHQLLWFQVHSLSISLFVSRQLMIIFTITFSTKNYTMSENIEKIPEPIVTSLSHQLSKTQKCSEAGTRELFGVFAW